MKEEDVPITIDVVKLGTGWELEKLRFEGFIDKLNHIQRSFNYQLAGDISICQFDPYTTYGKDKLVSAIKLKFKSARNLESRPYIIGVTVAPIEGNLFGFSRYKENIGVITTNQWEHFSPPDADVYLMYEIANRTLRLLVKMPPHMDWDRGCLFDYCSWKENIKLGMKSGCLCNDCVERLAEYERESKITRKQIKSIEDILNVVAITHGAKLVFIVTSADVSPQAFQQSCYFTLSGCCIVIVKLEEIQKIISTKSNVNEFLRKKVRNAYMRVPP